MKTFLNLLQSLVFIGAVGFMVSPYMFDSVSMDFGGWMMIVAVAVLAISVLEIFKKKVDPSHELGRGSGIKIMSAVLIVPVLFCALLLLVVLML